MENPMNKWDDLGCFPPIFGNIHIPQTHHFLFEDLGSDPWPIQVNICPCGIRDKSLIGTKVLQRCTSYRLIVNYCELIGFC